MGRNVQRGGKIVRGWCETCRLLKQQYSYSYPICSCRACFSQSFRLIQSNTLSHSTHSPARAPRKVGLVSNAQDLRPHHIPFAQDKLGRHFID